MKKFRFSLEGVSKLQGMAVRHSELTLARAWEALLHAESERTSKQSALSRSVHSAPRGSFVAVQHLCDHDAEVRRLQVELAKSSTRRDGQAALADAARGNLIEARRRAKAVEKLRERRYLEFVREILREEQKGMDETASRRYQEKRAA